ncbi:MAG: alpha-galactosidase [Acidobacteriota bacterium]|nr:alpha-galactosidase [Acidobacteriota bacterium]
MKPIVLLMLVALPAPAADWLVAAPKERAAVGRSADGREVTMSNGLIRRVWRLKPDAATVAFDNLMTGASLLRGVKPEGELELDGRRYPIGGLNGQEEWAYLRREWLDRMTPDPAAFHFTGMETGPTAARFAWKRAAYSGSQPWPPPGVSLTLHFAQDAAPGVKVDVHYEMYDALPVMAKWIAVRNASPQPLRLKRFVSEILAVVESESAVENPGRRRPGALQVDSDYSFIATHSRPDENEVAHWEPDPNYRTQVNYRLQEPVLLKCYPPLGPEVEIASGATFETFRVFELVHDSTDRERRGLAQRRMYRGLAPWSQENPILMHVRQADPASVKLAIDQCADVGFEMVIMTFGSGFSVERQDAAYLAQIKELVDYGRARGVALGGYSLLASRQIDAADDVVNPNPIFGHSPCLGSRWGEEYFRNLSHFIETTGLAVLEHDGSYPGDTCASTSHPGHRGLEDSQWTQWKTIAGFYEWCRARGVYLNVPDWYFLEGANKTAMGYRETNWSLPRERQVLLARQNIYDGTWDKTPSMGWMFVPLVQYQGGGAAATLEPLKEHLDYYERHLETNFTAGVQACYRGPRLYDSPETRAVVKRWVDFYKQHRAILESDIIHVRRPDGRDYDAILHVNPALKEKGLAVVHNPLEVPVTRTIRLPLYYTGLTDAAVVRVEGGAGRRVAIARDYTAPVTVTVPAGGMIWVTVE